ncbi:MAG: flagellar hook-basal body complex protein FliE [Planctomycetes bacterium]|nr:flagellar hook-basal body complex protein FliE [Planctomycetota bacterium]
MNVSPVGMMGGIPLASPVTGSPSVSNGGMFGNAVERFLADTNTQQVNADQSVQQLATGQSDSVHETMLALAKADLSLRVFMEVRNKVIDAYQEVMRMQM